MSYQFAGNADELAVNIAKALESSHKSSTKLVDNDRLKQAIEEKTLRNAKEAKSSGDMSAYHSVMREGVFDLKQIEELRKLNREARADFNELIRIKQESAESFRKEMDAYIAIGDQSSENYKLAKAKAQEQEELANNLIRERANAEYTNANPKVKEALRLDRQKKYASDMKSAKDEYNLSMERAASLSDNERKQAEEYAKQKFQLASDKALAERGDIGGIGEALKNGLMGSITGEGAGLQETLMTEVGAIAPEIAAVVAVVEKVLEITSAINKVVSQGVEMAANMATQYLGSIDARLAGDKDNITYSTIQQWMSENFATNPFVSQEKIMQNVASIVESGIAYNVEERALVETIKDKMVATFDVLDSSLTRLIRLQQADLTYTQLGAEAGLTELLNSVFQDTSYLSDMYDSVSSAILDATSQFSYKDATGYNYNVQKWLAALYSVGMSDSAVSTIAQGLTDLTTGNVTDFTSNAELTTLFGLAAKNANMSISDMLTNGLNASGVNELMKSMVTYLQEIVKNTGNQVTKSAWSNITNLSVSDLRAIQNLTASDISAIYNSNMDYSSASSKFTQELGLVESRTSIAEVVNNMKDNLLLTIGNNMIGNGDRKGFASYLTYTIGGLIGGVVGSALQTAVTLFGGAGAIKDIIQSGSGDFVNLLTGNGTLSDSLSNTLYTQARGASYVGIGGVSSGTSSSLSVEGIGAGPESGSAVTDTYGTFSEFAENVVASTISDTTVVEEKTAADIYKTLFEDGSSTPIRIKVVEVDDELRDSIKKNLIEDFHMEPGGYFEEIRNQVVYGNIPVTLNGVLGGLLGVGGLSNIITDVRESGN